MRARGSRRPATTPRRPSATIFALATSIRPRLIGPAKSGAFTCARTNSRPRIKRLATPCRVSRIAGSCTRYMAMSLCILGGLKTPTDAGKSGKRDFPRISRSPSNTPTPRSLRGEAGVSISPLRDLRLYAKNFQSRETRSKVISLCSAAWNNPRPLSGIAGIVRYRFQSLKSYVGLGIELARLREERGDRDGALRAIRELVEQSPNAMAAWIEWSAMLCRGKRFDEAERICEQAHAHFQFRVEPIAEMARLADLRGDTRGAFTRWKTAAGIAPRDNVIAAGLHLARLSLAEETNDLIGDWRRTRPRTRGRARSRNLCISSKASPVQGLAAVRWAPCKGGFARNRLG